MIIYKQWSPESSRIKGWARARTPQGTGA